MKRIAAALALVVGLGFAALMSGTTRPVRAATVASPTLAAEFSGYEVKSLQYDFVNIEGRPSAFIQVDCSEGKKILGGGAEIRDGDNRILPDVVLAESTPFGETGWIASIVPGNGTTGLPAVGKFTVRAICATVAE